MVHCTTTLKILKIYIWCSK